MLEMKSQKVMRSINGDPTSEGNKPGVRCADDGEVARKCLQSQGPGK